MLFTKIERRDLKASSGEGQPYPIDMAFLLCRCLSEAMRPSQSSLAVLKQRGTEENSAMEENQANRNSFYKLRLRTWRTICYLKEAGSQVKREITSSLKSWWCVMHGKVLYAAAPVPKRHTGLQKVERLRWKRLPWTDGGSCRDQQKSWCWSSPGWKRGFSLMSLVCTPNRSFLLPSTIWPPLSLHPVEPSTWGCGWPKDTELPQTHAVKPKTERTLRT